MHNGREILWWRYPTKTHALLEEHINFPGMNYDDATLAQVEKIQKEVAS